MPAITTFEGVVDSFIDDLVAKSSGGLTLTEFTGALMDAGKHASDAAATWLQNTGARKKEAVKDAVMQAFDALWPAVALKLGWLAVFAKPVVRSAVQYSLDAVVERIYQWAVKPNLPASEYANDPELFHSLRLAGGMRFYRRPLVERAR